MGSPHTHHEPVSEAVGAARHERIVGLAARFERDVIPLRPPLFRRAIRLTGNLVDAENLLQDTMLAAYVGFDSFREGTNLNAWLHRILANKYIDTYRKRQRQPVVYLRADITDELLAVNGARSSTGLRSAEDEALDTLPDTDIKTAMKALPEQTRLVVYYADVQDLKYRQIAEIMHIPQGTVMSRLHRGRRELRRLIADAAGYTGTTPTRRAIHFMQRGESRGASQRADPDELNAARARLRITDALGQLSAEHRALIGRSYYLGWTTAQIADDLQIAERFVKSRLHVALRALQGALELAPSCPGEDRQTARN